MILQGFPKTKDSFCNAYFIFLHSNKYYQEEDSIRFVSILRDRKKKRIIFEWESSSEEAINRFLPNYPIMLVTLNLILLFLL